MWSDLVAHNRIILLPISKVVSRAMSRYSNEHVCSLDKVYYFRSCLRKKRYVGMATVMPPHEHGRTLYIHSCEQLFSLAVPFVFLEGDFANIKINCCHFEENFI